MKIKKIIKGDAITKFSCIIMGLGHLFRGQKVRGIIYLLLEAVFAIYIAVFGGRYLAMFFRNFFTGGNVGFTQTHISSEWNAELGEYTKIPGDNSFHVVLYGILTLFVVLF